MNKKCILINKHYWFHSPTKTPTFPRIVMCLKSFFSPNFFMISSAYLHLSLVDLLGRDEVKLDESSISNYINGKRIMITGAGGSIGSELVRQCLKYEPALLVMLDISEFNLLFSTL